MIDALIEGWSDADLMDEVLGAASRHVIGSDDTRVVARPGWLQIITPSMTRGGLNEVSLAVLAPDDVEPTIDRVLAEYAAIGVTFRWSIGPDSAPPELGERLAARGLVRSDSLAMARAIADDLEGAVGVTGVSDEAGLVAFTHVMAVGWGGDPVTLLALHRSMLQHASGRCHLFVAWHDGLPVGGGAYIAASDRTAYLLGAVVLPEQRGRGHYRRLVTARMAHARARGMQLATSRAMADTSAPILARMGFVTVAPIVTYAPAST